MRSVWFFRLTRWGVLGLGVALTTWGVAAMFEGWDKIQIERGWSLFISGAVALSGGVVTLAIVAALSRLDHALATFAPQAARIAPAPVTSQPAPAPEMEPPPAMAPPTAMAPPPGFEAYAPKRYVEAEPVEVDRYENGGALYVMFSDGSVEIRGEGRVRRFSSLSELRAQVNA
ncbi:hypothetical protein A1351_04770 [Methylosinus sp. R-45379]|uniref:hypothetical protein n=1 Tax=Methylosinus sp. R-45379 TaxID=980563 RepID=UPI0007C95B6F|nr:hypothetical protein [Methylosinus sp. R-45379]OAI31590.1 hypothetical protein A1351_04770 [Methylosinus sp. R-45379]